MAQDDHYNQKNSVNDSNVRAGRDIILGDVIINNVPNPPKKQVNKKRRFFIWAITLTSILFGSGIYYFFIKTPVFQVEISPVHVDNGSILTFEIENNGEKAIHIDKLRVKKLLSGEMPISGSIDENFEPSMNIGDLNDKESEDLPLDIAIRPNEIHTLQVGVRLRRACIIQYTFYQNSNIVYENEIKIGNITE